MGIRNEKVVTRTFEKDLDKILATLVNFLAEEGDTRAVTVLVMGEASIEQTGGGYDFDQEYFAHTITLKLPETLYFQVMEDLFGLQNALKDKINVLTRSYPFDSVEEVSIVTELKGDPNWREKGRSFITGQGITNQGRARSDNLAPRQCDGLLFRSQPEIHLYRAFKALGVSFAPLPVFVRGGESYRRIEPDFVIFKHGILMIVEVDGDTVHKETPLEAQDRVKMLVHEGAHVERVNASECDTPEKASACARRLMAILEKLKATR